MVFSATYGPLLDGIRDRLAKVRSWLVVDDGAPRPPWAGSISTTATFGVSERVKVLTEYGREVRPGSEETGMVSISGALPLGYYKYEERRRRTFREVGGVRWCTPGDHAQHRALVHLALAGLADAAGTDIDQASP